MMKPFPLVVSGSLVFAIVTKLAIIVSAAAVLLLLYFAIRWLVPNLTDYLNAEKKTVENLLPRVEKAIEEGDSKALVEIAIEFGAKSLVEALSEHAKKKDSTSS
jgi:F0F1-type ATP synthase membrane subunit b/b'